MLKREAGNTSFWIAGRSGRDVKTTRCSTAKTHFFTRSKKQLFYCKEALEKCFFAVELRVVFTSRPLLPAIQTDVLPALLLCNVVYNFLCHCDSRHIGRTSQRLQDRIRQQLPKFVRIGRIPNSRNIFTRSGKSLTPVIFSESAIGQHLLDNLMCAKNYSDEKSTIL